jgi:hypothetical protein
MEVGSIHDGFVSSPFVRFRRSELLSPGLVEETPCRPTGGWLPASGAEVLQ